MMNLLEICCDSLPSALAAQRGGADRIELCCNLAQGGLSPSAAMIQLAKQHLTIPVFVLIRPRKADFLYSDLEFELMLEEIRLAKTLGADGIVSGALRADGHIDLDKIAAMVDRCGAIPFTHHRAFDMCKDPIAAIQQLADLGVCRILSSGQRATALQGSANLAQFAAVAGDHLQILACGELLPENIAHIAAIPGIHEFHSAATHTVRSNMDYRGQTTMGDEGLNDEFQWKEVDEKLVQAMKEQITI